MHLSIKFESNRVIVSKRARTFLPLDARSHRANKTYQAGFNRIWKKQQCHAVSFRFSARGSGAGKTLRRKRLGYGPDIPRGCGEGLLSESHGKERIRRKVIRRDGTVWYRGPRIKLGYLRNLMPHEPVFGTGRRIREDLPTRRNHPPRPLPRSRCVRLLSASNPRRVSPRPPPQPLQTREILPWIDTGDRSRVEKANRARSPRLESRTCLIERKKKKRKGRKERYRGERIKNKETWLRIVVNDTANRGGGVD